MFLFQHRFLGRLALFSAAMTGLALGAAPIPSTDEPPAASAAQPKSVPILSEERLTFQTSSPWAPRIHLQADVALVYGLSRGLPERINSWKEHGYRVHVMTGAAWGQYQDYLDGAWDGSKHWDQAQTDKKGEIIWHGRGRRVPYISPGEDYGKYLCVGVQRALDAGAQAILLEEPEFWSRAGYEENFKRQWKAYYGEDWQPPHSSVDAQYRASKLKYFLYRRALAQVFAFVKDYGKKTGRTIPCYVPTHSLINYAHWKIVSPESSLLEVGCDGYIAQVWTGTARTPNVYEGRRKERTFETAFLEYSAMQNLVRASGRRIWYLNDPVEDNTRHTWQDLKNNWENTLTASLLQPEVYRYEIMPWPERIFTRPYGLASDPTPGTPLTLPSPPGGGGRGKGEGGSLPQRTMIPKTYATELQAVIRALADMKQPDSLVKWEHSGTPGVGVLIADTMMFERSAPHASDANLGSFYGLALPLLLHGLPMEPVQIESAAQPGFLDRYRMLLLTYEGQQPPSPAFHDALAAWVRAGGALLVLDDDGDPYHQVRDWWNTPPRSYATPRHHLFEKLGLALDATGLNRVGKGVVLRQALSPAALTYHQDGAAQVRRLARQAAAAVALPWNETNALGLRRGPYLVAAGLDESVTGRQPLQLSGRFINLFDPDLPVLQAVTLIPKKRALLLDLNRLDLKNPRILAAACWVREETWQDNVLRFRAEGVDRSQAVVRIAAPRPPTRILMNGNPLPAGQYEAAGDTLLLRFPNAAASVHIEVSFAS